MKDFPEVQFGKDGDFNLDPSMKGIVLAGGCFWGTEEYMRRLPGVLKAISGYANGNGENPSYEEVCTGRTGFAEAVFVEYDSSLLSLKNLITHFFYTINPLQVNGQGNDRGSQYRSGIYYLYPEDIPVIEKEMNRLGEELGQAIATELKPLKNFYKAEEYHQRYLQKNPGGYCHVSFDTLPKGEEKLGK